MNEQTPNITTYEFPITLQGEGTTREEAWEDAVTAFSLDPGEPPSEPITYLRTDTNHCRIYYRRTDNTLYCIQKVSHADYQIYLCDDDEELLHPAHLSKFCFPLPPSAASTPIINQEVTEWLQS